MLLLHYINKTTALVNKNITLYILSVLLNLIVLFSTQIQRSIIVSIFINIFILSWYIAKYELILDIYRGQKFSIETAISKTFFYFKKLLPLLLSLIAVIFVSIIIIALQMKNSGAPFSFFSLLRNKDLSLLHILLELIGTGIMVGIATVLVFFTRQKKGFVPAIQTALSFLSKHPQFFIEILALSFLTRIISVLINADGQFSSIRLFVFSFLFVYLSLLIDTAIVIFVENREKSDV